LTTGKPLTSKKQKINGCRTGTRTSSQEAVHVQNPQKPPALRFFCTFAALYLLWAQPYTSGSIFNAPDIGAQAVHVNRRPPSVYFLRFHYYWAPQRGRGLSPCTSSKQLRPPSGFLSLRFADAPSAFHSLSLPRNHAVPFRPPRLQARPDPETFFS